MSGSTESIAPWVRFQKLGRGNQAELRRVATPLKLDDYPAVYRLFPGGNLNDGMRRVAFCLPWVRHAENTPRLGAQLARAGVSEQRLFQVMRSTYPNDIIQFRRLLQRVEPTADWRYLEPMLMHWGREYKRRLLEDFYTRSGISANVADPAR